ncbi:MAG: hypothetical protein ABSC30_08925 [Acidimicrobiales bacterium]|jgi:hypothetical protein
MDPNERRWVIGGGIVAIIGTVGCVLAAALPGAPKNPLEGGDFIVFLAVAVVGLALIVAAGARDALSSSASGARLLKLTRLDAVIEPPFEAAAEQLTVRPVYRNCHEDAVYRTRYEVAMQARSEVTVLLLEALAPSMIEVQFDDVRIVHQDVGQGSGIAWASVPDPPFLFRFDVVTGLPEENIQIRGSVC